MIKTQEIDTTLKFFSSLAPRMDLDYKNETVVGTMDDKTTPYEFAVLLKHFADKAMELGYWLEFRVV